MSPAPRCAQTHAKARRRHDRTAQERLAQERRHAHHAAETLQQALDDVELPADLVTAIAGRWRSHKKLWGKIVGVRCPPLFGCRTHAALCRVRGWDTHLPSRLLGVLPKRSWRKRLRRLGLDVLVPLWRHAASTSEATRSRWPWTWVGDDAVCKKYGEQLGLGGTWWSGQEHRVELLLSQVRVRHPDIDSDPELADILAYAHGRASPSAEAMALDADYERLQAEVYDDLFQITFTHGTSPPHHLIALGFRLWPDPLPMDTGTRTPPGKPSPVWPPRRIVAELSDTALTTLVGQLEDGLAQAVTYLSEARIRAYLRELL